jgi:hypothetical protein
MYGECHRHAASASPPARRSNQERRLGRKCKAAVSRTCNENGGSEQVPAAGGGKRGALLSKRGAGRSRRCCL